jgi:hypothetical protein
MPTLATVLTHWKSTTQGILMLVVVTCGVLLANPTTSTGKVGAYLALASALATAYIGLISKDSGVEVASVAGGPPKAVASHETPDDPGATPVKSKNVWGDTADDGKGKN